MVRTCRNDPEFALMPLEVVGEFRNDQGCDYSTSWSFHERDDRIRGNALSLSLVLRRGHFQKLHRHRQQTVVLEIGAGMIER
jgi:hypothetical protein